MNETEFEMLVRRERLESLLDKFRGDLRIAAEHVADLRGALDGRVGLRDEPLPRFLPPKAGPGLK